VKVRGANRLISMPYSLEVNDVITYGVYHQSPRAYADALMRHFDQLLEEGAETGTVMCIPLHPYLVGHPHRIGPFREALRYITGHRDDIWAATAREIAEYYRANHYDQTSADIARRGNLRPGTGFNHGQQGTTR
jgi:allantoinase